MSRLLGRWRCEATNESAQHGDGGRRDPRDPERLAERVWLDLSQPLHDLTRKAGHPFERKSSRNPAALISTRPLDLALLAPQVACVLDRRFRARHVKRRRWAFD